METRPFPPAVNRGLRLQKAVEPSLRGKTMLYAKEDRERGEYLTIGAGYCLREVSREETVLQGLQAPATLRGELYVELAALMDGTLRREDISARRPGKA